jgi:hypothetical protein
MHVVCTGISLFTLHVHNALPRLPRGTRRGTTAADRGHTSSAILRTSRPHGPGDRTPQHEAHTSPGSLISVWLPSGFQWKVCSHLKDKFFHSVKAKWNFTECWMKHVSHFIPCVPRNMCQTLGGYSLPYCKWMELISAWVIVSAVT